MLEHTARRPVDPRAEVAVAAGRETIRLDPVAVWLGSLAPATSAAYSTDLRQFLAYLASLGVDPDSVRPAHLDAWLTQLRAQRRAASTIQRKACAVRGFYAWARHSGLTQADPSLGRGRTPKVHTDDVAKLGLDRRSTLSVLAAAHHYGQRAVTLVTLLAVCGLRISEALGADVTDLGETRGHRTLSVIGKGARPRTVPLPPLVWREVETYLAGRTSGPLFITANGRRLDRHAAHETITAIGTRVGVKLHPHLLRHTAATAALDAGAPLDQVQTLLGHSSPTTTQRYIRGRQRLDASAAYTIAAWLDPEN